MKQKLRPRHLSLEQYGFYAILRDPEEVKLLRRVSQDLGWPSNASLIYLLAKNYTKNNQVML